MYEATWPYRFGAGILFFLVMGMLDLIRHPENPKRFKEYCFLFSLTMAALVYGLAHDRITYAISPDYFVAGKGITSAAAGFNREVAFLAIRATWWFGLLGGALLLIANNEDRAKRQLPYGRLIRFAFIPLASVLLLECLAAALCLFAGEAIAQAVGATLVRDAFGPRFFLVWSMHFSAYAGGAAGLLLAVVLTFFFKKRMSETKGVTPC